MDIIIRAQKQLGGFISKVSNIACVDRVSNIKNEETKQVEQVTSYVITGMVDGKSIILGVYFNKDLAYHQLDVIFSLILDREPVVVFELDVDKIKEEK